MKVVTIGRLKKMGACQSAIEALRAEFGTRIFITPANLTKVERVYGGALCWFAEADKTIGAKYADRNKKPIQCKLYLENKSCWGCADLIAARRLILAAARG